MDNSFLISSRDKRAQMMRRNPQRKLTTEEIKEIIRNAKHEPVDNEAPYADVPAAQPYSRPFREATREQILDASVNYGDRRVETERPVGVVIHPKAQPRYVQGESYMRAVIGDRHYGSKGKPRSRIDILNKMLW
jgi:hypothetical protein